MNQYLPDPIKSLAILFQELPGVGPKTALRFVFSLLNKHRDNTEKLARTLMALHNHIKFCDICGAYAIKNPCTICADATRQKNILCVVAESRDISTIEMTDEYQGQYHVLGGLLSPIEGATPDILRIRELEERISTGVFTELLLAFSSDIKGETTALFLSNQLRPYEIKITKLARGLPLGADLEYADEVTLADALRGRREVEQPKATMQKKSF